MKDNTSMVLSLTTADYEIRFDETDKILIAGLTEERVEEIYNAIYDEFRSLGLDNFEFDLYTVYFTISCHYAARNANIANNVRDRFYQFVYEWGVEL